MKHPATEHFANMFSHFLSSSPVPDLLVRLPQDDDFEYDFGVSHDWQMSATTSLISGSSGCAKSVHSDVSDDFNDERPDPVSDWILNTFFPNDTSDGK
jgi:hypothetical protein